MFLNYQFSYQKGERFIFVPNDEANRKGERLLDFINKKDIFPPYFYHYKKGGHVAALHNHLNGNFFFKIDIRRFFYSISRNRVSSALHDIGFDKARTYAKWSSVRNPYEDGSSYVLPIGFLQSPILASLVLLRTPIIRAIERAQSRGVHISVYLDDFIGSGVDEITLRGAYEDILDALDDANFRISCEKLSGPADAIEAFNCDLRQGFCEVSDARVQNFYSKSPSPFSSAAFEAYRLTVNINNKIKA